jgi:hypothetical protein
MLTDKYNYALNGIEHEIILNHTLKIDQIPINEKVLVSNKYMIKYINDLFDYHSIDYSLVGNSLLGVYIFNGINIFNSTLEICTPDSNLFKIKKIEDDIKNDGFEIQYNQNNIKISTIFFDRIKTSLSIYLVEIDNNDNLLKYVSHENNIIAHEFYDIYPSKKNKFEEFEVSVPNKIEKVLEAYNFNLNYISFTKNKKDTKKIIEEVEVKNSLNTIIKDNFNKVISHIKPFLFSE